MTRAMARLEPVGGAIPTLDQLAERPADAAGLPREALTALLLRAATAQSALAAALAALPVAPAEPTPAPAGKLLTVEQVAARLGISRYSVYENAPKWPFTVKVGRSVRFSEAKLAAWIERRARLGT